MVKGMKCYLCAEEGKETDALAVCIVCGVAVCKEDLVRDEVSFWEAQFISSDMSPEEAVSLFRSPCLVSCARSVTDLWSAEGPSPTRPRFGQPNPLSEPSNEKAK